VGGVGVAFYGVLVAVEAVGERGVCGLDEVGVAIYVELEAAVNGLEAIGVAVERDDEFTVAQGEEVTVASDVIGALSIF
jgi:hypothetical protein